MGTRVDAKWFSTRTGQYPVGPPTASTEQFFDLAADLLCIAGTDGYFKVVNQAWSETLGYEDGELLQRPFVDFVHPDDRRATIDASKRVANGSKLVHFRNRYRCKDGTYKRLAWSASPALSDGSIYAVARDVTSEIVSEVSVQEHCDAQRTRVLGVMSENAVRPVFQPIVNIDTLQVGGYEALSRFDLASGAGGTPDQWFAAAAEAGLRSQLEIHAIRKAVAHAYQLPPAAFLSLNASPETLLREDFSRMVEELHGECLIVEVTEHSAVEDYEPLQRAINRLRGHGVRLAIDDAGAGFATFSHILSTKPDIVKLDMSLIRDIHRDLARRALLHGLIYFIEQINATAVAEGVETMEEAEALKRLGVHCAQGYYFGRPGELPHPMGSLDSREDDDNGRDRIRILPLAK